MSDPRLHYLDVAIPFLTADGKLCPECFASDGLHPSPQGYAEWTRVIREPLLQQTATDPWSSSGPDLPDFFGPCETRKWRALNRLGSSDQVER